MGWCAVDGVRRRQVIGCGETAERKKEKQKVPFPSSLGLSSSFSILEQL